jgi:peptidyl-prolyl cis-trans isomerase SurA
MNNLRLNRFILTAASLMAVCCMPLDAVAQLRASKGMPVAANNRTAQEQADYIVAVVNSEPITHREVLLQTLRAEQRMATQGAPIPPRDVMYKESLERAIFEKIMSQQAKENGIRIDDPTLDDAIANIAVQNKLSLDELQLQLTKDGLDWKKFREDIRDELLVSRFREREMDARLRVSDTEIDAYIRERSADTNPSDVEINLAQILVPIAENSGAAERSQKMLLAQDIRNRLARGEDMLKVATSLGGQVATSSGELMGLKSTTRYPEVFVEAVKALPAGGISTIVSTDAGLHILKLVEKRQAGLPEMTAIQTRARHILLKPSADMSESAAIRKLEDIRQKILSRQVTFEAMASEFGQDGTSQQGGDLGWTNPGQFVPEFEAVMNQLTPGVLSQPVTTRFGVHLMEVMDRRNVKLSMQEQREIVRSLLREQKTEDQLAAMQRELRSMAYVEYRSTPTQ